MTEVLINGMIETSVMKELTKFTESEVKKENKFSRSRNFDFTCRHFNIYECLKWFEKPLWLINTKFCDITDMFKNTEAGVSRWSLKIVFLTEIQKKSSMLESLIKKYFWLIKKKTRHRCFPVDCDKFLRTSF